MHSFLKAEWKTILAVILFCGAIFGWFYHDEVEKERIQNTPYTFECLRAGSGLLDYALGTPLKSIEQKLQSEGFSRSQDSLLSLTRYERPDGAVALNFRDDALSAIEFYPKKTENIPSCANDIVNWKATARPVAQEIVSNDTKFIIYEGLVEMQQSDPISDGSEAKFHDHGWLVLAK
ncbi:MAG: hypothetical protein IJ165_09395 [Proteobacteria bacterium]|nr:hypothetical protein [Pseudomonadota bacterium]